MFFFLFFISQLRPIPIQRFFSSGPKVNTVEKLADLRRAGVNVGACSRELQRRALSYSIF